MLSGFTCLEAQGFTILGFVILVVFSLARVAMPIAYKRMCFIDHWNLAVPLSLMFSFARVAVPIAYKCVCFVDPDLWNLAVLPSVVF